MTQLRNETEVLSTINNNLNETAVEHVTQNYFFNNSLTIYTDLNALLNKTFLILDRTIDKLEGTVRKYSDNNNQLNRTVIDLSYQVKTFNGINANLSESIVQLNIDVRS